MSPVISPSASPSICAIFNPVAGKRSTASVLGVSHRGESPKMFEDVPARRSGATDGATDRHCNAVRVRIGGSCTAP
jgi:hypothetical protein